MSPNNGILLNGVLRPKLLNIPFASYYFINLDFLLLHTAHFDDNIALPVLVFNTFGSTFFLFCFFCISNNVSTSSLWLVFNV